MRYDPDKHHRHSMRLRGYDYNRTGAYFVTVCTQNRVCLFGDIDDGILVPNDAGQMIARWWTELPNKFPAMDIDTFVVMPNHFHGVLAITTVGADLRVCPPIATSSEGEHTGSPLRNAGEHTGSPLRNTGEHTGSPLLAQAIQWFKTMTTNEYIRGVKQQSWQPFPGKVWQRNYYEHIIRTEHSLNAIQRYIESNPQMWIYDQDNPIAEHLSHHNERDALIRNFGFTIEELDFVLDSRTERGLIK